MTLVAAAEDTWETTTTTTGDSAAAGAVLAGFGVFTVVMIILAVILGGFTLWMFIDALIRKDEEYEKIGSGGKVMWALLIFFLGFIPAIIYWFMIRKKIKALATK